MRISDDKTYGFITWCALNGILLRPEQIKMLEGKRVSGRSIGQSSLAILKLIYEAKERQSEIYYVVHGPSQISYMTNLIKDWANKCDITSKRGCRNDIVLQFPCHVSVIKVVTWEMCKRRTKETGSPFPDHSSVSYDHYWEMNPLPLPKKEEEKKPVLLPGMPWPKGFMNK